MPKSSSLRYEATGNLFIETNQNLDEYSQMTTYGLSNLTVSLIGTPHTFPLPDKFYCTAPTLQEARNEFFQRWRIYIKTKFHVKYIPIEIHQ